MDSKLNSSSDTLYSMTAQKQSIVLIMASTVLYVLGDLLIKQWLKHLPSIEVVLFRNLFGLFFLFINTRWSEITLIGERFWLLLSRGFLGVLSLTIFYYLIANAPLANAVVFLQSAALFTALFAYIQSNEKLSIIQIVCLVLGLLGVVLIVKPHVGFTFVDLLGIALAIVSALAMTSIKELNHFYNASSIVFSYFVIGTLFPLIVLIYNGINEKPIADFLAGKFVVPDKMTGVVLGALALTTTFGQLYKTQAYAMNKAGIVSTLSYSRIAFALIVGLMLGDAHPDIWALLGMGLITYSAWKISQRA